MVNPVEVRNLTVLYNNKAALLDISFKIKGKQIIGVIGPNGAGKSTLLKTIMGLINSHNGSVKIFNNCVSKTRDKLAYIPQRSEIDMDFPVTVEDVVLMGRYKFLKWWQKFSEKDKNMALECLRILGMDKYRNTQIGELSGGQQQRVFIARAIAQEPEIFFLDEPFTGIDIISEKIIINILRKLKEQGKTVLVVHHDLKKAEEYFDMLLLLNKRLIGFGEKNEIFKPDKLKDAYEDTMVVSC